MNSLIRILFVLILPQLTYALVNAEDLTGFVMCRNRKVVRTVRVEILEDKSCQTQYTKNGVDRVIGSGVHKQSCMNFMNNVRKYLEEVGWACKDVQSVQFSAHK